MIDPDIGTTGRDEIESTPVNRYEVGAVFQINEKHARNGWVGAFVLATEIKSWGIQGFVSQIETHDQQNHAYIRLKWEELDYIGNAPLVPER